MMALRCSSRKIDILIEKKQRLIELLEEQRSAIIYNAATKGIDPNAKMKNSNISWLGEIPEHWALKKLKYLVTNVETGRTPPSEMIEYYEGGDIEWFTPSDFNDSLFLIDSSRKITQKAINDRVARLYDP